MFENIKKLHEQLMFWRIEAPSIDLHPWDVTFRYFSEIWIDSVVREELECLKM